jgi:NADPH:quinone reductase-like Zn-dependent oxidoreductase
MHAIVHRKYGTPDVLAYEEIERPVPADEDVLVRVHAAGASIGDHIIVTGKPYLIRLSAFGGWPRPRNLVPGACMAGRVEAVGAKVTTFRPGDDVYGEAATGAFAEYIVVPAKLIAPKPSTLSFEEAAAAPWGVNALQGLRDSGGLKAGQRVLINGASGGVGTWAVQIAKALGGHVTAVCSTRNVEMVRTLGAHEVVDYTKHDFVDGGPRLDVMLDTVGNRSVSDCKERPGAHGCLCLVYRRHVYDSVALPVGVDAAGIALHEPEADDIHGVSQPEGPLCSEAARRGREAEAGHRASLRATRGRRCAAARGRATLPGADRHPDCRLEPQHDLTITVRSFSPPCGGGGGGGF